jgi:hypothetical protein
MREFDAFPPIELFKDDEGRFWLGDGVHRVEAAKANGATTILARVSDGGERAALLHAANANSAHGLRRTTADKRRAVELVYRVHPEWLGENSDPEGTDRQVAAKCGVDHKTVGAVKRALKARGEIPQSADGEGESAVKPVSKRKPKRPIKPDRAVKLARRELDRVFKDWPLADDRALFFRTVNDWLAENESAITKAPTAEAAE